MFKIKKKTHTNSIITFSRSHCLDLDTSPPPSLIVEFSIKPFRDPDLDRDLRLAGEVAPLNTGVSVTALPPFHWSPFVTSFL